MAPQQSMQVTLIGLDTRAEAAFRIILAKAGFSLEFGSDAPALLIVDHDGPGAAEEWARLRALNPAARSLVIAADGVPRGDGFLPKPFNAAQLNALARRLCAPLTAPVAAAAPARPPRAARASRDETAARYDPARHLQRHLLEAANLAQRDRISVQVGGLPGELVFCGESRLAYTALSDHVLRPLCAMPLQAGLIALRRTALTEAHRALPKLPAEVLLWKTAIWTARGRFPLACDPDQPVRLRRWPNLTRLNEIPYALRIAALWNTYRISPRQMVTRLDIPSEFVFDFFGACDAQGLLDTGHGRPLPSTATREPDQPGERSLLGWIIDKLRGL
jgi:hypothetical protein